MQISQIPVKTSVVWASGAGGGYITVPVPIASQIGVAAGRASFSDGFVPLNFVPVASGGDPPWGADMNGILYQVTQWLQWQQAGGVPVKYDATFSAAIGGYPVGAMLQSATLGHFWISSADNNPTNPDTGGANWIKFPDALIQIQAGNYALDTGAANAVTITLSTVPASLASIVGSPIRFKANHPNSVAAPTININGLGAVTMINSDGTALAVPQITRTGQICEGYLDGDGFFQLVSPGKPAAGGGSSTAVPIGGIIICPIEMPFVGTLECAGTLLTIATYPALFNVIQAKYGGNGTTTFALPDYRGVFVRGWDHGRGKDPNASTRTNRGDGTTGDHVGTNQQWATGGPIIFSNSPIEILNPLGWFVTNFPNTGDYGLIGPVTASGGGSDGVNGFDPHSTAIFEQQATKITGTATITGNTGSVETRPTNITGMYVIFY